MTNLKEPTNGQNLNEFRKKIAIEGSSEWASGKSVVPFTPKRTEYGLK